MDEKRERMAHCTDGFIIYISLLLFDCRLSDINAKYAHEIWISVMHSKYYILDYI